jgi:hypothetical protein
VELSTGAILAGVPPEGSAILAGSAGGVLTTGMAGEMETGGCDEDDVAACAGEA